MKQFWQRHLGVIFLPLAAATGAPAEAMAAPTSTLVYLCDQHRVVSMTQPDPARPGQDVSVVFGLDRRQMTPAVAASGARYLSTDGQWQWWTKGLGARLSTAGGTALAENCAVYPPRVRPPGIQGSDKPVKQP